MAINVLEANLKDALSDHTRMLQVTDMLLTEKPDVAVFPEAYKEGQEKYLEQFQTYAQLQGYVMARALYKDTARDDVERRDRHGLMVLALGSLAVGQPEFIPLGRNDDERRYSVGRTAIKFSVRDEESHKIVDVFAGHFDDRNKEDNVEQARTLLSHVNRTRPTIVAVDANSAPRKGLIPMGLRALGSFAERVPKVEPGTPKPSNIRSLEGVKWVGKRAASLAYRLGQMAHGETVDLFTSRSAGFSDDDPKNRATMSNKFPIAKLDHVFTYKSHTAKPLLKPVKNKFSDHRYLKRRVIVA